MTALAQPNDGLLFESVLTMIEAIRLCRIRVFYRAVSEGRIEGFLGPEIRGSMGKLLKAYMDCTLENNEDCRQCSEERRQNCVFAPLYYDHDGQGPKGFALSLDPAFRGMASRFVRGETLQLDLVLVGDVIRKGIHILNALKSDLLRLGREGTPFVLEEAGVVAGDRFVPLREIGDLAVRGLPAESLVFKQPDHPCQTFEIHLLTPTELTITHKNYVRKPDELTFKCIVIRTLERVERLARGHCGWQPRDATEKERGQDLIDRAGEIALKGVEGCRWTRVSLRKTEGYWRGGLIGRFRYEGDPAPYLGLLEAARELGLGRGCTIGLGQMFYRTFQER